MQAIILDNAFQDWLDDVGSRLPDRPVRNRQRTNVDDPIGLWWILCLTAGGINLAAAALAHLASGYSKVVGFNFPKGPTYV